MFVGTCSRPRSSPSRCGCISGSRHASILPSFARRAPAPWRGFWSDAVFATATVVEEVDRRIPPSAWRRSRSPSASPPPWRSRSLSPLPSTRCAFRRL